ncbi:hypothetical protein JL2886_00255 [Phaeobacter gallaeciensis]|uniref:Uncharacterized protein n=1 Tax=Phaeobacter gallaeciensis TaxID=60890 RepID=A0A1B0ZM04_9RHOB|nr:hypothetical protein JL2886_00255 [Phaeobacter gallaeciensis]
MLVLGYVHKDVCARAAAPGSTLSLCRLTALLRPLFRRSACVARGLCRVLATTS